MTQDVPRFLADTLGVELTPWQRDVLGQIPREFQFTTTAADQLGRESSAINAAVAEYHFARKARIRRMHQQYARRHRR